MKYICSALLLALIASVDQVTAIKINQKATFTDDLVKSLAEEMQKDSEEETPAQPAAEAAPQKPQAAVQKSNPTPAPANVTAAAQKHAGNASANATAVAQKHAVKAVAVKVVVKKQAEDEEIPMDAAAIKAYSSVIADAAEDSEPSVPVQYTAVDSEEHETHHDSEKMIGTDPMGSMIQNEITSIKMASIKASED